jgi:spore germination cell wall hydrolase CwlJ-like protein
MLGPIVAFILLCGLLPAATASAEQADGEAAEVTLKIDGAKVKLADPLRISNGRLFLPVASLANRLGAKTVWDSDNEAVTIHTAYGDEIVLSNGVPVVYFNDDRYRMDVAPFVAEGRIYIPLRSVAELLHADVKWDAEAQLAELDSVKPAVVTEEYGLTEISEQYGVSKSALLERNKLNSSAELKPGAKLQVVIPSIFDNKAEPYTEKDYLLLAKLTQVESGYESYEGQLAVANVVLNRVKDSRFPNTIRDVIYSGKQFPVAHNGLLDKSVPNASVLRAAKDALNGKNNIKDAVYFYNPRVTKGAFWSGLDTVATFGTHRFAK